MSALDYSLDALEQAVKAWQEEREELRNALRDMLNGWIYIRQFHGDLSGVGWDRAQGKAERALNRTRIQGEFAPITQPERQS